jgi:hypothetical protein
MHSCHKLPLPTAEESRHKRRTGESTAITQPQWQTNNILYKLGVMQNISFDILAKPSKSIADPNRKDAPNPPVSH